MSIFGIAKRGFGRALKAHKQRKMLKGTSTRSERLKYGDRGPTIKSVKPGVGGLKKSRDMFESLQKSTAIGVKKFGRPHTTKVLSGLKGKKTMGSVTKQAGDLERLKKATEKKFNIKLDRNKESKKVFEKAKGK